MNIHEIDGSGHPRAGLSCLLPIRRRRCYGHKRLPLKPMSLARWRQRETLRSKKLGPIAYEAPRTSLFWIEKTNINLSDALALAISGAKDLGVRNARNFDCCSNSRGPNSSVPVQSGYPRKNPASDLDRSRGSWAWSKRRLERRPAASRSCGRIMFAK
jgi:hypothetical protein